MSKKRAAIYLKAAEAVFYKNRYTCCAIADAAHGKGRNHYEDYPEPKAFSKMFAPTKQMANSAFWLAGRFYIEADEHDWRVLALCFMAAMEDNP